jgi:hypothetical protein
MSRRKVTFEEVTLTRPEARRWLDRNIERNRPPSTSIIERYAADMDNDRWIRNGSTIKFNDNDEMFDGQQRIRAFLVSSLKTMRFDVARGLDPTAVRVTDIGRKRNVAQSLAMDGVVNATIAASLARRIICWDRGNYMGQVGRGTNRNEIPSDAEMYETYHRTPAEYDTAAARGADARRLKLGAPKQAGTAFFLFHRIDKQMAHDFFDHVLKGTGIGEKHPAWLLRERLRSKESPPRQCALWIRAWNAFREDEPLDRLQVPAELSNSNHPTPR